jgi:hypothetical protein
MSRYATYQELAARQQIMSAYESGGRAASASSYICQLYGRHLTDKLKGCLTRSETMRR